MSEPSFKLTPIPADPSGVVIESEPHKGIMLRLNIYNFTPDEAEQLAVGLLKAARLVRGVDHESK